MPDIALRFHKDMLVLSAPPQAVLARQGVDEDIDMEYLIMVEPEALQEALRLEKLAGAQCVVLPTEGLCPACLAHKGLEERGAELASAALRMLEGVGVQHTLAEIGPSGLPLDASSKASLNENRAQYARAARSLEGLQLDALFLDGFTRTADLKCALMGVRQVSDLPLFASVELDASGQLVGAHAGLEEALEIMEELGASVAGIECAAPLEQAQDLARRAAAACDLPLLYQLKVCRRDPKQGEATAENPYYCADTMVEAALALRQAGVQFLRASGDATPAYSGALAATTVGLDVVLTPGKDA